MTADATTTTNTSSAMNTTSVANVPPFTILSSLLGCDPTRSTGLLFNPLIAERSPGADGSDPVRDRTLVRERPSADATHADRKSTRLNSSHLGISYAVFCLK